MLFLVSLVVTKFMILAQSLNNVILYAESELFSNFFSNCSELAKKRPSVPR